MSGDSETRYDFSKLPLTIEQQMLEELRKHTELLTSVVSKLTLTEERDNGKQTPRLQGRRK